MIILRTCKKNGTSYNNFQWPKEGPVEAPDWDPTPICGYGLHGFANGKGNLNLLSWEPDALWQVVEVEDGLIVDLGEKVKYPKGNVIFSGDREGALKILADKEGQTVREWVCSDPEWAYEYAKEVDKVPRDDTREGACKEPNWAYLYARDVDKGPRDDTRAGSCKNPEFAYMYAQNVGVT